MATGTALKDNAGSGVSNSPSFWFPVGAGMGPFADSIFYVLIPTLQRDLHTSLENITAGIAAYMLAYALGQLTLSTLADRLDPRKVLLVGFGGFVVSSLIVGFAPGIEIFLLGRALQGLVNSCTTPIVISALGEMVPPSQLGRALGRLAAFNTLGKVMAPIISGVLVVVNWRLSYVIAALIAFGMMIYYDRQFRKRAHRKTAAGLAIHATLRTLLRPQLLLLYLSAALAFCTMEGIQYIISIDLQEHWTQTAAESGFILAIFPVVNLLAAPLAGMLADRIGWKQTALVGAGLIALLLLALSLLHPPPLGIGLVIAIGGIGVAFLWGGLTPLAVHASPERRTGVTTLFNAAKFSGIAFAPMLYTPLYKLDGPGIVYLLAAGIAVLLMLPVLLYHRPARTLHSASEQAA